MKNTKKALSLCLALVIVLLAFTSCSDKDVVMELDGHKISAGMYQYWMSRYKALFLYSYANGSDSQDFWNTEVADGVSAETLFTNIIDENIKKNLVCMFLFDEYGLKLSAATEESVIANIEQLIEDLGGKKEFNEYASSFGVDDKKLKEIYLIEEKIEQLREHLYGKNGIEKITEAQKQQYYEENYARIRHIFFSTSTQYVLDEKGNYTYDENGNIITRAPTDAEIHKQKVVANAVYSRIKDGENFEALLEEYSEDKASKSYQNGFYLTSTIDYINEVTDAAFDMDVNEIRLIESDYGVHIVKKYALDVGAYYNEENADFFEDFEELAISDVFQDKIIEYLDEVKVNTEEKEKYSVVNTPANLQF